MRKLSLACPAGATHHALAACAITEAGTSKKNIVAEGFRRNVSQLDYLERTHAGEYWCELVEEDNIVRVKTYASECIVRWRFTWPELRMLSFHLYRCHHIGGDQPLDL